MRSATLCMTATIRPNTTLVHRSKISERLKDYKAGIRFYLEETALPIVFVENSDFDLSRDADFLEFQKGGRFTMLRYAPHPEKDRGKGFQEFYMLDEFVKSALETDYLIKITGRYIIRNISKILAQIDAPLLFDLHLKKRVAITGFFIVEKDIYSKYFIGIYRQANDDKGRFIEHVVYDIICNSTLINYCKLLPENPQFEGISGSHGHSMQRNKYKMLLRKWERKLNRYLNIRQFLIEY